jgi:hypothetical protein
MLNLKPETLIFSFSAFQFFSFLECSLFAGEHARPGRSWTRPRAQPFARVPPDHLNFPKYKFPARAREIAPVAGALPISAFQHFSFWLYVSACQFLALSFSISVFVFRLSQFQLFSVSAF